MKGKYISLVALLIFIFCNVSCATSLQFENPIFTGFVFDENNNPVSGMEIKVRGGSGFNQKTRTNDSGLFQIYHLKKGNVTVQGKKEGCTKLDAKLKINDFTTVYCMKVISADSVLEQAVEFAKAEEFENAFNLLESLEYSHGSELEKCVAFYKTTLKRKEKNK